jgi:hypothetical protein
MDNGKFANDEELERGIATVLGAVKKLKGAGKVAKGALGRFRGAYGKGRLGLAYRPKRASRAGRTGYALGKFLRPKKNKVLVFGGLGTAVAGGAFALRRKKG